MKIGGKKIILVMVLLLFGLIGYILAEEAASLNTEDLSSPEKAFLTMQTALQNENYEKVWQMSAESVKQKFGGNFEEFKKDFSEPEKRVAFSSANIQEIKLLTPEKAEIKILVSFVIPTYMILEDGVWKFAGKAEEH